jgi:hypothetical protein
MINLSNLKPGQSKDLGEVTVSKMEGYYELATDQGVAELAYDKDAKEWRATYDGLVYVILTGATTKTAVEMALANWPKTEATPEPAEEADEDKRAKRLATIAALVEKAKATTYPEEAEALLAKVATLMGKYNVSEEELRRQRATEKGEEAGQEKAVEWDYVVNTEGGHAPHRVAAFCSVANAMGGSSFYTHSRVKGKGYRSDTVTLHVVAPQSVINDLKLFIPAMSLAMERLAEQKSREVSHAARKAGMHHSGPGCHARRGFMRGFGVGIADRVRRDVEQDTEATTSKELVVQDRAAVIAAYMATFYPNLKSTKAQKYDQAAWVAGHVAGQAFASPQVTQEPAAKQLQNA